MHLDNPIPGFVWRHVFWPEPVPLLQKKAAFCIYDIIVINLPQ